MDGEERYVPRLTQTLGPVSCPFLFGMRLSLCCRIRVATFVHRLARVRSRPDTNSGRRPESTSRLKQHRSIQEVYPLSSDDQITPRSIVLMKQCKSYLYDTRLYKALLRYLRKSPDRSLVSCLSSPISSSSSSSSSSSLQPSASSFSPRIPKLRKKPSREMPAKRPKGSASPLG